MLRPNIFKLLRSLRIDSKEPITPGCVTWQAGTTTLFLAPIDCLKESYAAVEIGDENITLVRKPFTVLRRDYV